MFKIIITKENRWWIAVAEDPAKAEEERMLCKCQGTTLKKAIECLLFYLERDFKIK